MSSVIQFPAADERAWIELARGLREAAAEHVSDSEAIDWILADLKPRFMQIKRSFSFSHDTPAICEQALTELAIAYHLHLDRYTDQWLLQMLLLEIELYQVRSG